MPVYIFFFFIFLQSPEVNFVGEEMGSQLQGGKNEKIYSRYVFTEREKKGSNDKGVMFLNQCA